MALLCFILDLPSLSSPLLKYLKQIANLYAISSGSSSLQDRIGLCYVQKNKASGAVELKIAYSPQGKYNLRDFHHAVNSLPTDGFIGAEECSTPYEALAKLLSNEFLFSWGNKDIQKKAVLITSRLAPNMDSLHKLLKDAAEQCISMEFVLLKQEADHIQDMSSNKVKQFADGIASFNNCSLRSYFPNTWILCALVKRWAQELKDKEGALQALFLFKNGLLSSVDYIFCNLFLSACQIIDGFSPCQTCRCHGLPIDGTASSRVKLFCPVAFQELEACDLFENAVRVGEQTVLFLPSFESCPKLKQVSTPIVFNVIERTKLASLSEGVVIGTSYVVTPTCPGMEDASDYYEKSQVNLQLYHGLCEALYSLDEGLICYSNCNTQTMLETTFQCFYILQPSEHGPMFLRRLAGKEEILPIPEGIQSNDALLPKDIGNSIQTALSKLELREYNPLLHERGLHSKLNWLVKESLHFGSISWPNRAETISKEPTPNSLNPTLLQASTKPSPAEKETMAEEKTQPKESTPNSLNPPLLQASMQPPPAVKEDLVEEKTQPNLPAEEDMAAAACISQEWEELIITEVGKSFSPTCVSKPTFKNLVSSLPDNKPLDEKTSRILERLEDPRKQKKIKETSPVLAENNVTGNASGLMKKPLVPFGPNNLTGHHLSLSQPIKPSFQRMKRKLR